MNTVILTSVLSAGNHALFAGTRVLYGLAVTIPTRHAPRIFSRTTRRGVPLAALLATSSVSVLCFGSSFIGSGALWGWLQNLVGVSNQVCHAANRSPRVRLTHVFFFSFSPPDRMAFDRSCELEVPTSVACPRTTVERNEIPCELDMAVGPSLCGMALSLLRHAF
jgi:hypothetical protein